MQHKNPSHPIGSSWQVSAHAGDAFQWFTKRMSWHSWASYVMLDVWGCGKMFFFFSRLWTWNLMLQSLHTGSDLRNISSVWDTIDIYIYRYMIYISYWYVCCIWRYLQISSVQGQQAFCPQPSPGVLACAFWWEGWASHSCGKCSIESLANYLVARNEVVRKIEKLTFENRFWTIFFPFAI